MAAGLILGLFGLWVLLRTVVKGSNGKNLADYILGLGGGSSTSSNSATNPYTSTGSFLGVPLSRSGGGTIEGKGINAISPVPIIPNALPSPKQMGLPPR